MHIFIGILVALVGAGMVIKTEWLIVNFGTNEWAESKMAMYGGSRMLYKLMGLAAIIIGFMLITDLFQAFLLGTVGRMFPRP